MSKANTGKQTNKASNTINQLNHLAEPTNEAHTTTPNKPTAKSNASETSTTITYLVDGSHHYLVCLLDCFKRLLFLFT